jgi:hypothetical protein
LQSQQTNTRAFFSKWTLWSRLLPFRSLLGRFNRINKGADFRGVKARQNCETVRPQALQKIGERSHRGRCGRPPSLNYRGNKGGYGRRSSGLSIRAANCNLKKERRKRGNVRRPEDEKAKDSICVNLESPLNEIEFDPQRSDKLRAIDGFPKNGPSRTKMI